MVTVAPRFSRALIFCNGEFASTDYEEAQAGDLVFCADGGLHHALNVGLKPHVILGDFDSIDADLQRALREWDCGPKVMEFPREKDKTDGQLAVEYALDAGIKDIWLYGSLGHRIDHTLGNLFLAWLCLKRGARLQLVSKGQRVVMLRAPARVCITGEKGDYVSLIPLTPTVSGVTATGLYYPLQNDTLHMGETRGLSNELVTNCAAIEATSGVLIVVNSKQGP